MPRERYMAYVLTDPRAPEYARYVGYGMAPAPWRLLVDFRDFGTGRLYDWLRNLGAHGLEPAVPRLFCLGRLIHYSEQLAANGAEMLEFRLRRRAEELDSDPDFLLNDPLQPPRRIIGSGEREIEFESFAAAARAGFARSSLYEAIKHNRTYKGYLWRVEGQSSLPVDRVADDGEITSYPSIAAASRAAGVSRPWIVRLLRTAERDPSGFRWRVTPNKEPQVRKTDRLQMFSPVIPPIDCDPTSPWNQYL